jgi:GPH family glycoside/pentoside/hexuronide:cation symporter
MNAKIPFHRKLGYAAGDYGCNLYWQSSTFFLLYFYTDIVGIPVASAGLIYAFASIFDVLIDPIMWILMDRTNTRWGRYRPWMMFGAGPLALSFSLLYWSPASTGLVLFLIVSATHLLFRICYTIVGVPLASLSARLTVDALERTTLASLRMTFGAAATVTIGFATQPLVQALGHGDAGRGLARTAVLIAIAATLMLLISVKAVREPPLGAPSPTLNLRECPRVIAANPAFLSLVAGLVLATLSTTAITKSLIYYFKYVVGDENSARYALAAAAVVSLMSAPAWGAIGKKIGKRALWLSSASFGLIGLALFLILRPSSVLGASLFFAWMQVITTGIQVGYWGTLPDTVEFGEWRSGRRLESVLFGLFMLIQKAALGLSAGIYSLSLSYIGYRPNLPVASETAEKIGLIMALLSGIGLVGSVVATWFSPLRRGVHEKIVTLLEER